MTTAVPHLVVLHTPGLDTETDMNLLCRSLADALLAVRDEAGAAVFPVGGVRVFALEAAHAAVADGSRDCAFVYLNLRMGRGRSAEVHRRAGEAIAAAARAHFAPLLDRRPLGLTLQIDEGAEVFDAKLGNLHAMLSQGSAGPPQACPTPAGTQAGCGPGASRPRGHSKEEG